ncbi:8-amino-7-oxononanoate synthase [Dyadobacter endophyticus]|uniref:8-amino-7-oxononanoate synthase n=1 Tax=Dyadobacter endophyticus TaxID=1749036 RepID=A0ABQ1YND8_9BACT|nr:aminotransferase class I/II-fold pyridoxal phosphate-dependent enzyme [Dyadobacter endophyticus]GGH31869.1 8-amino-7-oxononanoate synthase [Dyadobacter endophyticus]
MNHLELNWHNALSTRKENGHLRRLRPPNEGCDFYSNDYLGLSADAAFQQTIYEAIGRDTRLLTGSTGSRLISGNSDAATGAEKRIATAHQVEDALLFPSGYKANLALFSCIAGRHDTIIVDELIHRSVHDGCLMSTARKWKFRHNDLTHLEALLKKASGNVVIAVESLYSMEGDFAPLGAIVALAKKYQAGIVVDEAHAIGVFGKGLVHRAGLQQEMLATVVTYGKAMGVQGAAVLGTHLLKEYLVNFAAPFIYSTGMPGVQIVSITAAYDHLERHPTLAITLQDRIRHFRKYQLSNTSQESSPIQSVQFQHDRELRAVTQALAEAGIGAYALFPPTVGQARLRVSIHAFNSHDEIDQLCGIIQQYEYRK